MRGKEDLRKRVGKNSRADHSLGIIGRIENVTSVISLDISGRIVLFGKQKRKMQAQVVQMCLKAVGKMYCWSQMDVLIGTTHGCWI